MEGKAPSSKPERGRRGRQRSGSGARSSDAERTDEAAATGGKPKAHSGRAHGSGGERPRRSSASGSSHDSSIPASDQVSASHDATAAAHRSGKRHGERDQQHPSHTASPRSKQRQESKGKKGQKVAEAQPLARRGSGPSSGQRVRDSSEGDHSKAAHDERAAPSRIAPQGLQSIGRALQQPGSQGVSALNARSAAKAEATTAAPFAKGTGGQGGSGMKAPGRIPVSMPDMYKAPVGHSPHSSTTAGEQSSGIVRAHTSHAQQGHASTMPLVKSKKKQGPTPKTPDAVRATRTPVVRAPTSAEQGSSKADAPPRAQDQASKAGVLDPDGGVASRTSQPRGVVRANTEPHTHQATRSGTDKMKQQPQQQQQQYPHSQQHQQLMQPQHHSRNPHLATERRQGNVQHERSPSKQSERANKKQQDKRKDLTEEERRKNYILRIPQDMTSTLMPNAKYFCVVCSYHLRDLPKLRDHLTRSQHDDFTKAYARASSISSLPQPDRFQLSEIERGLLQDYELVSVEKDLPRHQAVLETLRNLCQSVCPDYDFQMYSGSCNGCGLAGAPVRMVVKADTTKEGASLLLSLPSILEASSEVANITTDYLVRHASVSGLHLHTGLRFEVYLNEDINWRLSNLIAVYAKLDVRFQQIATLLCHWATVCDFVNEEGCTLPLQAYPLLAVYALQRCNPPVLPVLHELGRTSPEHPGEDNEDWHPSDIDWINSAWRTENTMPLSELWLGVFRLYCDPPFLQDAVISIRTLNPASREEKNFHLRRLAVEDPIHPSRNMTGKMSFPSAFSAFLGSLYKTLEYYSTPPSNLDEFKRKEELFHATYASKNVKKEQGRLEGHKTKRERREAKYAAEEEAVKEADVKLYVLSPAMSPGLPKHRPQTVERAEECWLSWASDYATCCKAEYNTLALRQADATNEQKRQQGVEDADGDSDQPTDLGIEPQVGSASSDAVAGATTVDVQSSAADLQGPDAEGAASAPTRALYRLKADSSRDRTTKLPSFCQACRSEGHVREDCPALQRTKRKPLPVPASEVVLMVDGVCTDIANRLASSHDNKQARLRVLDTLQYYVRQRYPGVVLQLFGSSDNGFGFEGSDMDVCIVSDEGLDKGEVVTRLRNLFRRQKGFDHVMCVTNCRVPIVKFVYAWSYKPYRYFEVDISLGNVLALENTRLMATYAAIDPRVRQLGLVVKYFAKVCEIGDASRGSLSSYAYILMMLHYLQRTSPPVIPNLQEVGRDGQSKTVADWDCWFFSDLSRLHEVWPGCGQNVQTVGQLWIGFLRYYSETFDFYRSVVTTRTLRPLLPLECGWAGKTMCIEDPFLLSHNLAGGLAYRMRNFILDCFANGLYRFSTRPPALPQRNIPSYFFNASYLRPSKAAPHHNGSCRTCNQYGHFSADCPNRRQYEVSGEEDDDGGPAIDPPVLPLPAPALGGNTTAIRTGGVPQDRQQPVAGPASPDINQELWHLKQLLEQKQQPHLQQPQQQLERPHTHGAHAMATPHAADTVARQLSEPITSGNAPAQNFAHGYTIGLSVFQPPMLQQPVLQHQQEQQAQQGPSQQQQQQQHQEGQQQEGQQRQEEQQQQQQHQHQASHHQHHFAANPADGRLLRQFSEPVSSGNVPAQNPGHGYGIMGQQPTSHQHLLQQVYQHNYQQQQQQQLFHQLLQHPLQPSQQQYPQQQQQQLQSQQQHPQHQHQQHPQQQHPQQQHPQQQHQQHPVQQQHPQQQQHQQHPQQQQHQQHPVQQQHPQQQQYPSQQQQHPSQQQQHPQQQHQQHTQQQHQQHPVQQQHPQQQQHQQHPQQQHPVQQQHPQQQHPVQQQHPQQQQQHPSQQQHQHPSQQQQHPSQQQPQ